MRDASTGQPAWVLVLLAALGAWGVIHGHAASATALAVHVGVLLSSVVLLGGSLLRRLDLTRPRPQTVARMGLAVLVAAALEAAWSAATWPWRASHLAIASLAALSLAYQLRPRARHDPPP